MAVLKEAFRRLPEIPRIRTCSCATTRVSEAFMPTRQIRKQAFYLFASQVRGWPSADFLVWPVIQLACSEVFSLGRARLRHREFFHPQLQDTSAA